MILEIKTQPAPSSRVASPTTAWNFIWFNMIDLDIPIIGGPKIFYFRKLRTPKTN